MTLEPGVVIGERYRIGRKLGDGGMGSVYEAEHTLIRRRVAIKVLHPRLAEEPEIVERFWREAQAATAIGHANIIEVTDFGSLEDGSPFMVLEYLEGRDWAADLEREGPQALGKVAHIVTQVCQALSVAHEKGIVHRDLKPENVFLLERGGDPNFAKILDFGISKLGPIGGAAHQNKLTRTGTALGTPYYMSPEQCQGRADVDHRTDLYSLGVMLFQALAGQYPFDDQTYPMLVLKICTQAPPELTNWRADVPSGIALLIGSLLAKDRELRPQSCAEVEAALRPYIDSPAPVRVVASAPSTASIVAHASVAPTPVALTQTPQRSATPWIAIGLGVVGTLLTVLILLVGGVWLSVSLGDRDETGEHADNRIDEVEDPSVVADRELDAFDEEIRGQELVSQAFIERLQAWARADLERMMNPRYHLVLGHAYARHASPTGMTVGLALAEYDFALRGDQIQPDRRMLEDCLRFSCHENRGISQRAVSFIEDSYGDDALDEVEAARDRAPEECRPTLDGLLIRLRSEGSAVGAPQ